MTAAHPDDGAALASRFATGDAASVRDVYRRYGGLVFSVAYELLGDVGLAEDATRQAFVQAWRAADSFDPARALPSWLTIIARQAAIDVRWEQLHRQLAETTAGPSLVTRAPFAEEICAVVEVRRALTALPAADRELIRMQHFQGLTHTGIASHLQIPVAAVKSRSIRAHRRLASILDTDLLH
jgi:RNA polymerase sigma-70 factor (ECF subfamily)